MEHRVRVEYAGGMRRFWPAARTAADRSVRHSVLGVRTVPFALGRMLLLLLCIALRYSVGRGRGCERARLLMPRDFAMCARLPRIWMRAAARLHYWYMLGPRFGPIGRHFLG